MTADPLPSVVLARNGEDYEIQIHNPNAVIAAIGERLYASFYKCFVGVDRILALEHLMELVKQAEQAPAPSDSHAIDRERVLVGLLLAGTLYEMGAALQELCNARVVEKMNDRSLWEPLNKLRGEWNTERYARTIRNGFAHHLGEIENYEKGIRTGTSNPVVFQVMATNHRLAGKAAEPWEALFRGYETKTEEIRAFIDKAYDAHSALPGLLNAVFFEVLRSCKIAIEKRT